MKKKILSMILTAVMLLALLPSGVFAATEYGLWIAGVRVTSDNLSGSGWSFDPATSTLTFDGFDYSGEPYEINDGAYSGVIISTLGSLKIKGRATIENKTDTYSAAIFSVGSLIFDDAELNIKSESNGILSYDDITVNSGSFNIESYGDCMRSEDNFYINGGCIDAVAGEDGIDSGWDIIIKDGTININSGDDGIDSYYDTEIYGGKITINADSDGIYVYNDLKIDGGDIYIDAKYDGIDVEDYIYINGGNIVIVAEDNGIELDDEDIEIHGGKIDITAGDDGFNIDEDIEIYGGVIVINAADIGMFSDNDDIFFKGGNVLINSGSYGIFVEDESDYLRFENCNISITSENAHAMNKVPEVYGENFNSVSKDYGASTFTAWSKTIEAASIFKFKEENEFPLPLYVFGAMLAMSEEYTVTAESGENGSISPDDEVKVRIGMSKTFTIKADKGYEIESVIVDGEDIGAVEKYTFENVAEDHTISATFKKEAWVSPYKDVEPEDGFYADVEYVTVNRLMDGVSSRRFAPKADVDAIDVLVALCRLAGNADADETAALLWAAENGLVSADAKFDASGDITFAEAIAMVGGFAENVGIPSALIAPAKAMLEAMIDDVTADITRAEAAACLRLIGGLIG